MFLINATRGWPFSGKLLSNVRELRRAERRGGCAVGCDHDRTADDRLPWESDGRYGGWGGHAFYDTEPGAERTPVVFVHGNQRDACDFEQHADFFRKRGYRGDELWAITFGRGSPTHEEMAAQLDTFVEHVRDETGTDSVALVGHSLGVTGIRFWLHERNRYEWVDTVVGLAGANHGTVLSSWCADAGMTDGVYRTSQFLRADYETLEDHPLATLNADETPGEIEYHTIRGTGDPLFWGCEESPELAGATNVVLDTDHDGVRTDRQAVARIFRWISGHHPYDISQQVAISG